MFLRLLLYQLKPIRYYPSWLNYERIPTPFSWFDVFDAPSLSYSASVEAALLVFSFPSFLPYCFSQ